MRQDPQFAAYLFLFLLTTIFYDFYAFINQSDSKHIHAFLLLNIFVFTILSLSNFQRSIIIILMRVYLLLVCLLFVASAHKCQQVGTSSLAKLTSCVVETPAPQLKWTLNITLLQDYTWRGADEIRYYYMKLNDDPIDETCYTGQTIKGKYLKGSSLLVEQLCFNFKPSISKGDKLYIMIFWDLASTEKQVVYFSFSANGQIEDSGVVPEAQRDQVEQLFSNNLVTQ